MGGGLLLPQGLRNLAGSGGISQFAMSMLHPHVLECVQLSSQAEGPFIGSQCNQVSAVTHPFNMADPANMQLSLPQSVVVNHGMRLQHILKGNTVTMAVAGRALQYAAERDRLMGRYGDNTSASESFVTALNSLPPNSDARNDTEYILFSDSNDDLSSGVTYVPSEQSETNEDEPSEQSETNEDVSVEASQTSSTEAATAIPVPSPIRRR
eukprot:10890820-Ditylum_brightwellii.AAC.1